MNWLKKYLKYTLQTYYQQIDVYLVYLSKEFLTKRNSFDKHLQDLIWIFWFGKPLHKRKEKGRSTISKAL